MRSVAVDFLIGFDVFVLAYFLVLNTSYLVLLSVAGQAVARSRQLIELEGEDTLLASPLLPGISLVLPAYNEETVIVESVQALLAVRYPSLEVIVVVDGATDGTLAQLVQAFDLVEVPAVMPGDVAVRGRAHSLFLPRGHAPLVVVSKDNSGRADSCNAGIDVARHPLVCMVDADSILDPDALLRVARPFVEDPDRVVGSGGVVRPVNGCRVLLGRVIDVRMPRKWLERVQAVEYLRAFLMGRVGWSRLGSLLVVSGAFGLFRRDVLVAAGGLDASCLGEDAELVVRLHRFMREQGRPYRIVFVPKPVSWTEVPASLAVLGRQRLRWSRGLAEVLWKHRRMLMNPRYGRIGLVALPYALIFELLAPIIEVLGFVATVLALALGVVDLRFAWELLLAAYGYGFVLSLATLLMEEVSFHRYRRWVDLGSLVVSAALENFWYRQLNAIYGLHGLWAALRKQPYVWGAMPRSGFTPPQRVEPVEAPR
jgi:cellulose synthase/poly-beta-1,6-N-acetylglucosamine synthase-like glycosyltransferase